MKDFLKFLISKKFLISLAAAIVIFFLLAYFTLVMIDKYTSHGESVEVPEIRNLRVDAADVLLVDENLRVEVIDSLFNINKAPGVILEQDPLPGSKIKKGRKVYVVINSMNKKQIDFPEIKEYPARQAQSIITSQGLKIASIEYVPSQHENLVLYAKIDNKIIDTGSKVPVGSKVVLVVGKGKLSETTSRLNDFSGLAYDEAEMRIYRQSMNVGAINYDVPPLNEKDKKEYFIYQQEPEAGSSVNLGTEVSLWLTKDKSKLEPDESLNDDEILDDLNF